MVLNLRKALLGLFAIGCVALGSGCAHSPHTRGSVAFKEGDQEAHVCLGNSEVKTGDRVALFKSECTGTNTRTTHRTCTKVKLGEGVVTKALNEHYSNVKVDDGVAFEEGAIVEKL